MPTKLLVCDPRSDVVEACAQRFAEVPPSRLEDPPFDAEVEVRQGDIFECDADAILLPGNSFGFLDRGLELVACERWGFELQDQLRERIRADRSGELLVGEALVLPAPGSRRGRSLVYAPIYRTPRSIDGTLNAYLAARGALLALAAASTPPRLLALPGIGTGNAGLHPAISARQLRYAWDIARGARDMGDKNLTRLSRRERKLAAMPLPAGDASAGDGGDED